MKSRSVPAVIVAIAALALTLAVPAAANAAWGAIAINPSTGDIGVGFGEVTKNDAQNEAEKDCKGKCRQALYVRNKCGAIALNGRGRLVAGFGNSKHEAIKKAKRKAKKAPGKAKLVAWVCSG
jgi:serine/threonine-protein kinase